MVIIHVYENNGIGGIDPTPHTVLEHILQFLAGPVAAPVFMFSMGVGLIYSRHRCVLLPLVWVIPLGIVILLLTGIIMQTGMKIWNTIKKPAS